MQYVVKFLAVVEVAVKGCRESAIDEAQATLDSFREVTLPSLNFGVTIYRATADDMAIGELLENGAQVLPYLEIDI